MSAWTVPPLPPVLARAARASAAATLAFAAGAARFPQAALDFALPQRCPGCGAAAAAGTFLCAACRDRIPALRVPLCAACLVRDRDPVGCVRHTGVRVHAPWVYDEHVATLVHALKYGGRPGLAAALGPVLASALPPAARRPDLVLAVPLHPARRRERGYNQAALLADALARSLGVVRLAGALARVRATAPQARLGQAARRANVAGAFRVERPALLEGRRVLLVDDVLTTGATMEACLMALARTGADATGVALAWAQ